MIESIIPRAHLCKRVRAHQSPLGELTPYSKGGSILRTSEVPRRPPKTFLSLVLADLCLLQVAPRSHPWTQECDLPWKTGMEHGSQDKGNSPTVCPVSLSASYPDGGPLLRQASNVSGRGPRHRGQRQRSGDPLKRRFTAGWVSPVSVFKCVLRICLEE